MDKRLDTPTHPPKIWKKTKIPDFLIFLDGRWEDLDRWKWVVIDVGVILDTSATHSENCFVSTFV